MNDTGLLQFLERARLTERVQVQFPVDDGERRGSYVTLVMSSTQSETWFVGTVGARPGCVAVKEN